MKIKDILCWVGVAIMGAATAVLGQYMTESQNRKTIQELKSKCEEEA